MNIDPLAPARGICLGFLLSACIWGLAAIVWLVFY